MAGNESNYLVNKIDQDPSGSRTAKFLGITNGESDVKATADVGGQRCQTGPGLGSAEQISLKLSKHLGLWFFYHRLCWAEMCSKEVSLCYSL